jgi:hypothetical protein
MKIMGVELKAMGYTPTKDEYKEPKLAESGEVKPRYATIYADSRELPLDLKGFKAGDDVLLVCKAHIAELTTDRDTQNEPTHRVQFEIHEAGVKPFSSKRADEMSDAELEEAIDGKKDKKG